MQSKANQKPPTLFGEPMERIPDNVLLEPIEYIFADHCRQRDMCTALQELAKQSKIYADKGVSNELGPEPAQRILDCLHHDLPLHIADEEQDLFPRLNAKAQPQDKIADILRLLSAEHERDHQLIKDVMDGLESIAASQPLDDPEGFRTAAEVFSASHLSHLHWENAVVLELARRRLDDEDKRAMSVSMAARRSIDLPGY